MNQDIKSVDKKILYINCLGYELKYDLSDQDYKKNIYNSN